MTEQRLGFLGFIPQDALGNLREPHLSDVARPLDATMADALAKSEAAPLRSLDQRATV